MFWGEPDSSVHFCEDKYATNDYVAEYYNTLKIAANSIFLNFSAKFWFQRSIDKIKSH